MFKLCSLAAAGVTSVALAGLTTAQPLILSFDDLGGGVFSASVTNNTAFSIVDLEFGGNPGFGDGGFSGNFDNFFGPGTFIQTTAFTDGLVNGFAETYFFLDGTAANTAETATRLEGAYGNITDVLNPGETQIVAYFSTSDGIVPTFEGGTAAVNGEAVAITLIPEPASAALLAAGLGIAGLRRRSA